MKDDWDRVQAILYSARRLAPAERESFLSAACGNDPDVMSEVRYLLGIDKVSPDSSELLDDPDLTTSPDSKSTNVVTAANLIGATIGGRFEVERKLEQGGMGEVYFAVDQKLDNRPVAIKILSQEFLNEPNLVQRFRQEARALALINHPGVVGVLDADELDDGTPYIVMQYVEGKTLRSQISNGRMELKRVASILSQIGDTLDHVHKKGIFHRDLKPENIMLEANGVESVKIIDFGIAKLKHAALTPITMTDALLGTVMYMSPEQLRGGEITAASDVYSMALIAYEMISGRRPFDASSASQLLAMQHEVGQPASSRWNVPRRAQSVLQGALLFEPSARYQSAGEFGNELARALLGRPFPTWLAITVGALLIIASLVLFVPSISRWTVRSGEQPTGKSGTQSAHACSYWLTVQRTRDGKNYQDPFQSFGEEIFENGDKFRLNVSCAESGYIYIFNEGPPEANSASFRLIYPAAAINNGSAMLGANQLVQSEWITFRGPAGAENFWIVWSFVPVDQLESAKAEAFKNPKGALTNQSLVATREFLRLNQLEIGTRTTHYKSSQMATIRSASDMFVKFIDFKHR